MPTEFQKNANDWGTSSRLDLKQKRISDADFENAAMKSSCSNESIPTDYHSYLGGDELFQRHLRNSYLRYLFDADQLVPTNRSIGEVASQSEKCERAAMLVYGCSGIGSKQISEILSHDIRSQTGTPSGNLILKLAVNWQDANSLRLLMTRRSNESSLWAISDPSLFECWVNRHLTVSQATRSVDEPLSKSILTDPAEYLIAFEKQSDSASHCHTLALYAETLDFSEDQRSQLIKLLTNYISKVRISRNREALVAVGSAIRTLIAYLPIQEFDSLAGILHCTAIGPVVPDVELEVVKGLCNRLTWDIGARSANCPFLQNKVFDLANFHSSMRTVQNDVSNAIAVDAIILLALFRDARLKSLLENLPFHSLSWFPRVVKLRAKHFFNRLENRGSNPSSPSGETSTVVESFFSSLRT
jgi:hypothetical protein